MFSAGVFDAIVQLTNFGGTQRTVEFRDLCGENRPEPVKTLSIVDRVVIGDFSVHSALKLCRQRSKSGPALKVFLRLAVFGHKLATGQVTEPFAEGFQ